MSIKQAPFLARIANDATRRSAKKDRLKQELEAVLSFSPFPFSPFPLIYSLLFLLIHKLQDPECTFQPQILAKSNSMSNRTVDDMCYGDLMKKETKQRQAKLQVFLNEFFFKIMFLLVASSMIVSCDNKDGTGRIVWYNF